MTNPSEKTKEMKLRAFQINNKEPEKKNPDTLKELKDKLNSSKSASERRMILNKEDADNESDLLSFFQSRDQGDAPLFCTMMRIKPGENVQHINQTLLNKPQFTIDELDKTSLDKAQGIYKEHYYFSISQNFLVTTLPGNCTIQRLQTYINWLLNSLYELSPCIEEEKLQALSNISNVTFSDPFFDAAPSSKKESLGENKTLSLNIRKFASNIIWNLLKDTKDITEIELEQIISAKLVIQFQREKKSDSKETKKALSAILKPIADTEHVSVKTKDNKTLTKGKDLLKVKSVKIDITESGLANENTLSQNMEIFLRELENEYKKESNNSSG